MAYTLSGHKSGFVRFMPFESTINQEREAYSGRVTQYPIETGSNINDHVLIDPYKLTIDGVVCGGMDDCYMLETMHKGGEICTYVGHCRLDGMVITQLNITHTSQNKYGATISATLQHVIVTTAEYVGTGATPMSIQDKGKGAAKTTKNKGQESTGWGSGSLTSNLSQKTHPSSGPLDQTMGSYNGLN